MKALAAILTVVLPLSASYAGDEKPVSAARLLDEIIQRPGGYAQMCDAPPHVPFYAPPIPAYGLSVSQSLYPSDEMNKLLRERRDEVVKEIAARLEKLDWLHQPPTPAPSEKPLLIKAGQGNAVLDPTKPSGQNPLSLDSIMLTIILDLDAVELLPHLLRLEDELHKIAVTALNDDHAPLPVIEIGGSAIWQGIDKDYEKVENWDKLPPKLKRKRQLFDALVFDRELIGVMLELIARKKFAPMKDSTLGRVRALVLREMVGHRSFLKNIKRPEDIPELDREFVLFDREIGIPYWRDAKVPVPYTEGLREESLQLVKCFLDGTKPPVVNGEKLLDELIAKPGNFNQMCGTPPPLPFDAPLPAYSVLAPRHYSFGANSILRLQSYRKEVMLVLLDRLKNVDLSKAQPTPVMAKNWEYSRSNPRAFSSLLLSVALHLQAIEALPELLRLEDQLHSALLKAEKDEKAPLPQLELDSPVGWSTIKVVDDKKKQKAQKPTKEDKKSFERKTDLFTCRIYQRELLALIARLLREEKYQPLLASSIEKEYIAGLRTIANEGELKDIKSLADIPEESQSWIRWDDELGIPVLLHGSVVKIPYTETLRDDLRHMADDFLKNVPPAQWKGAAAMKVSLP